MAKSVEITVVKVSWPHIREMVKLKGNIEHEVARCLRAMLDELGEKAWLEACEKEMGWGRTSAYKHLNPELLEKAREKATEVRSHSVNAAPRQSVEVEEVEEYAPPTYEEGHLAHARSLQRFCKTLLEVINTLSIENLVKGAVHPTQTVEELDTIINWLTSYRSQLKKGT